jgi:hypothetical protein
MGLVYNNFRVFFDARRRGASFDSVLTLGRQQIYLSKDEVQRLAQEFPEYVQGTQGCPETGEYCEPWLRRWLGCNRIESMDASAYEGATLVHDLNRPIPEQYASQFSAVIDGGSIEHVFFITTAIANAMQLTSLGGWLFVATVANNHCGHGFYQFSPEWFFRVFSAANGFEIADVLFMPHRYPGTELSDNRRLYRVADPAQVGRRVGLVGAQPVLVFASARRVEICELFQHPPHQSDYVERWQEQNSQQNPPQSPQVVQLSATVRRLFAGGWRRIQPYLPRGLQRYLSGCNQLRDYRLQNQRLYVPWHPVGQATEGRSGT